MSWPEPYATPLVGSNLRSRSGGMARARMSWPEPYATPLVGSNLRSRSGGMARARMSWPEPYASSLVGNNLRSSFYNNHRLLTKQLAHRHQGIGIAVVVKLPLYPRLLKKK